MTWPVGTIIAVAAAAGAAATGNALNYIEHSQANRWSEVAVGVVDTYMSQPPTRNSCPASSTNRRGGTIITVRQSILISFLIDCICCCGAQVSRVAESNWIGRVEDYITG